MNGEGTNKRSRGDTGAGRVEMQGTLEQNQVVQFHSATRFLNHILIQSYFCIPNVVFAPTRGSPEITNLTKKKKKKGK